MVNVLCLQTLVNIIILLFYTSYSLLLCAVILCISFENIYNILKLELTFYVYGTI